MARVARAVPAGPLEEREEGGMDDLWSVTRFVAWLQENGHKASRDHVTQMCRDGTLPAVQLGRFWFIDTKEILKRKGAGNG